MATFKKNLFLQGASGMLGGQLVYKTVNGQTIVSTKPVRRGEATEAQKRQNTRFKYASIFAKAAVTDAVLGPIYAEATKRLSRFRNAYQMAITDYLKSPEIGEILLASGISGSEVLIEAFEDPKLAKVEVAILDANEAVVSTEEATLTSNGIQWRYVLPQDIPENGSLEVRAYDLPGNVATKSFAP